MSGLQILGKKVKTVEIALLPITLYIALPCVHERLHLGIALQTPQLGTV